MPDATQPDPNSGSGADLDRLRRRIFIAAQDLVRAESARQSALEDLGALIWQARRTRVTWAEIATLTGLSERYVRYVADRLQNVTESKDREGTGVSISEAARLLNVTRPTIYARIERGELTTVHDSKGRLRVLIDTD